jgi:hypothetical protein
MFIYPNTEDESLLLHNDCKTLIKRISRQSIILEVEEKLFNNNKLDKDKLDKDKLDKDKLDKDKLDKDKLDKDKLDKDKLDIYYFILKVLGCDVNL